MSLLYRSPNCNLRVNRFMHLLRFLGLLFAGLLAACTSPGPIGPVQTASGPSSKVVMTSGVELPPADSSPTPSALSAYRIAPFDRLEIGVFGIDALATREYRVDAEGRISFPLAGTLVAGGLTPSGLEDLISGRLRAGYVRDPQVTVNVRETVDRVVTVAGEVEKPGPYPVLGRTTLVRAIAAAGGTSDFAKTDEVIVFRTVGGKRLAAIYDLRGIQRGNYDDPEIYAHDLVVVGDSPQRRLIRDAIGAAPAILAPLLVTIL